MGASVSTTGERVTMSLLGGCLTSVLAAVGPQAHDDPRLSCGGWTTEKGAYRESRPMILARQ
jgi:hypothetical protein